MFAMDMSGNQQNSAAETRRELTHAYVVPDTGMAGDLAAAAVCSGRVGRPCGKCAHCAKASRGLHPDIITVDLLPDKREILVDQIRAIKEDVIVVPNEAEKKVYVIRNADSMNKAAQNALLRVLEDPPGHAMFVLSAENPAGLLPTVRSRCVELRRPPEPAGTGKDHDIALDFIASLSGGALALTEFSYRLDKLDKQELAAFLDAARKLTIRKLRDTAQNRAARERLSKAEQSLCRAREYLDLNVAAAHISGLLLASLI